MADHADREVDCDAQQEPELPDQAAPAEIALVVERENVVVSILDRLRQPEESDLSRKRKLTTNNPASGNRRSQSVLRKNEPNISARKRVDEFKGETFIAKENGSLFCQSCREEMSVKKQNISVHVSSIKHKMNKDKLSQTSKKDQNIAEAMKKYDEVHHPKGETLPTGTRVFRVKVVKAFLKSGTPLNRMEYFRDLFEDAGFALTSSPNMRQLIPFILEEEYKAISKEVMGKDISIVFDGTTRDGEALVVLVRFVESWEVQQRLVRFQLVKQSVNGDELARIIINVLHRKLNVPESNLLAAMRDRAPVNTKALRTVSVLYPDIIDIGCISHFLDRVGVKCKTPLLKQFMTAWNYIFTTSMKGRRVWKAINGGRSMPRYNNTRWWSLWECVKIVFEEWRHLAAFIDSDEEFAQCSREKLSQILADNAVQLRVEMAAFMELEQFVKTTYTLEGDGTLIFIAYEKLLMLKAFIQVQHFPTLTMTVQELFPANAIVQQQWYQYGLRECLTPAFEYYAQTLANDVTVSRSIEVFQAAQLFCPKVVTISRPNAAEVEKIRAVPFLGTNNIIQALQVELAAYLVKADQIPHDFDTLSDTWPWWRMVARELPSWSSAVQKLVLVQSSSAAAERVFSLLTTMFGDQQHEALEDYVEAALMLRVNDH